MVESEEKLRSLKTQKLRADIRQGLESGPAVKFDSKKIKRAARAKKSKQERLWKAPIVS